MPQYPNRPNSPSTTARASTFAGRCRGPRSRHRDRLPLPLLARRHAEVWFEAADHYGIDCFLSMTPLEEVVDLLRDHAGRVNFIAVPKFRDDSAQWRDDWLMRLESFYNLGSRIAEVSRAPRRRCSIAAYRLDSRSIRPIFREIVDRKMAIMTHIGDPDTWYGGKYLDTAKYGTREEHYQMWETCSRNMPALPGSAPTWAAIPKTCTASRVCSIATPSDARLQRHPLDGARDQRPAGCRPRVLHPQPGPHFFRLRSGQRRRSRLRFPRQPILGAPQALGNRLHRPDADLRS